MLALDWLGLVVSGALLGVVLRGRRRLPRAVLAVVLGEAGRAIVVLLAGHSVVAMTLAGAFTQVTTPGLPAWFVQAGGLLTGAALGLLFGRQTARDTLLYAALAGGVIWFFAARR